MTILQLRQQALSNYRYEDKTYLCKGDMIPCVWTPGTAGLWQWEAVS